MTKQVVRLLATDPRDMVPSAVRWARAVEAAVRTVPRAQLPAPSRTSLLAVTWVLAAAADYDDRIPADHTAGMLAREADVGDRVFQKRTAWLRERGWLQHGPGGPHDGWALCRGGDDTGDVPAAHAQRPHSEVMTNIVPQCTDSLRIVTDRTGGVVNLSADEDAVLVRLTRPLTPRERQQLTASWRGHRPQEDARPRIAYVEGEGGTQGNLLVPVLTAPRHISDTFRLEIAPVLDGVLARCADE